MAHAGADAGDFVGGNANADAGPTNEYAARSLAATDGQADALGVVRVVVERFYFIGAQVGDIMAGRQEVSTDFFFERKSGVIGCDYEFQRESPSC
jgi:hypothetical protein